MMRNADMPAMPQAVTYGPDGGVIASYDFAGGQGLTKREHFAAMAMQASLTKGMVGHSTSDVARQSASIADALLAELERTK